MKHLIFFALLFGIYTGVVNAASEPARVILPEYKSHQVVMYATSWCPYCQQARNYFREQGIPYIERDIEKDAEAKRAYQEFGGRGIPVIFVGKRRIDGFSEAGFNRIYR